MYRMWKQCQTSIRMGTYGIPKREDERSSERHAREEFKVTSLAKWRSETGKGMNSDFALFLVP